MSNSTFAPTNSPGFFFLAHRPTNRQTDQPSFLVVSSPSSWWIERILNLCNFRVKFHLHLGPAFSVKTEFFSTSSSSHFSIDCGAYARILLRRNCSMTTTRWNFGSPVCHLSHNLIVGVKLLTLFDPSTQGSGWDYPAERCTNFPEVCKRVCDGKLLRMFGWRMAKDKFNNFVAQRTLNVWKRVDLMPQKCCF